MVFSENQRTFSTGSFHVLWVPKKAHQSSSACMFFSKGLNSGASGIWFLLKNITSYHPHPILLLLYSLLLSTKPITQIRKLQRPEFHELLQGCLWVGVPPGQAVGCVYSNATVTQLHICSCLVPPVVSLGPMILTGIHLFSQKKERTRICLICAMGKALFLAISSP
jgi:hypothetical protein